MLNRKSKELLAQYRERCRKNSERSKKYILKASVIYNSGCGYLQGNSVAGVLGKLVMLFKGIRIAMYVSAGVVMQSVRDIAKRNRIKKILRCSKDEIAVNISELQKRKDVIKYFADDFRYDMSLNEMWLKNIELIFGNVHLEALKELSCLNKLENIFGDVYFAKSGNLDGLKLRFVSGDFHGEQLESAEGMENLQYVGGTVYYQNKAFRGVKELRSFQKQSIWQ